MPIGIDEHAFDPLQAAKELHLRRKRRALRDRFLHGRSDGLERYRARRARRARPSGVGQGTRPLGRQRLQRLRLDCPNNAIGVNGNAAHGLAAEATPELTEAEV